MLFRGAQLMERDAFVLKTIKKFLTPGLSPTKQGGGEPLSNSGLEGCLSLLPSDAF